MPGMGMGMPMAAPPKVVKYELCKPKLDPPKEGKTKAFGWKRVVVDRKGLGGKPASNEVVDNGLRKLDSNYKGLKVIWINIEEDKNVKLSDIQALFKDKVKAAPANIAAVVTQLNKKKSIFTDKAQNLMIMLSRLPDAPTVLTAVTKLKMTTLNAEKLGTLINNWPTEDMNELMEEAKNFFTQEKGLPDVPSDYPQLLNTWEKPEAFFIFLGKERKFDTRLRLWKFKIDFEPKAALLKSQLN